MEPTTAPEVPSETDHIPTTKRYWKESNGLLCSICLEPDHQARNCSHQLCLTCGAIDEHITRQCPVSLVCHSCGSRGHLARHCPSSRTSGAHCARCDSTIHLTLNCPSIWRAYEEETNDKPQRIMRACYYCGNTGDHFGDECPFRRPSLHTEPSAFSDRSVSKRDSRHPQLYGSGRDSSPRRKDYDRQHDVGRQDSYRPHDPPPSRKKPIRPGRRDRAANARAIEVEDDDDWFSKRQRKKIPPKPGPSPKPSGSKPNRIGGSYKGGYIK
ncbi:hypothetical protein PTTG_06938 [Puccinia triticina 1-1 BBBD Race 1]|uniref:CCHC-type domain-containing protein n=2 Tax=Puccinia triticina TaxID=208348 RepID=A0A0C4F1G7_PUCT1|nr:uncharacterized protein PtA15_14A68 [Puccinia triticina]OAV94956.1 hypothetical protein PTTG_06938 [Puccinia triticina 1-1 BBBD Race 1]WAQ91187.1 hypothetical protein PtA15_14A68 [Puccinia triticina]WAR61985.1 hypothetical protein PtB15_14B78 [Puccinia triticina]